jgi:tol-pal system protein YbgF
MILASAALLCCGASERTVLRLDNMEKDVSDVRRAQHALSQRVDELQIQISILNRKLEGRPVSTAPKAGERAAEAAPSLNVVRLHPPAPPPPPPSPRSLPAVDPDQVEERLPVDTAAARRPLLGPPPEPVPVREFVIDRQDQGVARAKEFDAAFSSYRVADYDTALPALQAFARKYAGHELAADALVFLGRAQLNLGQVEEARGTFEALVKEYPKSPRAAEALLLDGRCFERSGRTDEARGVYLQLVQAYPLSSEAAEANRRLESIR